jgi:23S rRNA pseudouridine2604 synthase
MYHIAPSVPPHFPFCPRRRGGGAALLTADLNRQIRRMCEALGYMVEALQRVRIMHIKLGELPIGRWRQLSAQEIAPLLPASAAEPAREPRRAAAPRSRRSRR